MKRNFIVVSLICLTVVVTLAFQNCNNKQFAADGSGFNGGLTSMDQDGNVDGEVDIITCKVSTEDCPSGVIIKFYAVVNNQEVYIDEVPAHETSPGSYSFTFQVPSQYKCRPIVAYAQNPLTGSTRKLPSEATFSLWGNDPSCGGSTNGGGSNGGNNGGANGGGNNNVATAVPKVVITGHQKNQRLIEVVGQCTNGADVNFSQDVDDRLSKVAACTNGSFKFCTIAKKYYQANFIRGQQSLNNQVAQDVREVPADSVAPVVPVTYDSFVKSGEKGLKVTGRCYPGGKVLLNIYNGNIANVDCQSNGTYVYDGTPLVDTTGRILHATHTTPFGVTVKISADVDMENVTPSCSITDAIANTNICTQQAGTVKGNCYKDLPVHISVNGKEQDVVVCSAAGKFEVSNVVLEKLGMSNELKIEQKTPYGKSCNATRMLSNF